MIEQKSGVGFAVDNKKSYNRLFVQNRSGVIVFLAQIDFFGWSVVDRCWIVLMNTKEFL